MPRARLPLLDVAAVDAVLGLRLAAEALLEAATHRLLHRECEPRGAPHLLRGGRQLAELLVLHRGKFGAARRRDRRPAAPLRVCWLLTAAYAAPRDPAADIKAAIDPIVAQLSKSTTAPSPSHCAGAAQRHTAPRRRARSTKRAGAPSRPPTLRVGQHHQDGDGRERAAARRPAKLALTDAVAPIIDPFLAKLKAKDLAQNFSKLSSCGATRCRRSPCSTSSRCAAACPTTHGELERPPAERLAPRRRVRRAIRRAILRAQFSAQSLTPSTRPQVRAPVAELLPTYLEPAVGGDRLAPVSPGACDTRKYYNCYSSSNFVLLGLLPAQLAGADDWTTFAQQRRFAGGADFTDVQFAAPGRRPPRSRRSRGTTPPTTTTTRRRSTSLRSRASSAAGRRPTSSRRRPTRHRAGPVWPEPQARLRIARAAKYDGRAHRLRPRHLQPHAPHAARRRDGPPRRDVRLPVRRRLRAEGELAVAVGTNIERDEQDQPADVFCHVYNTAAAILQGLPVPTCTYSRGYWSGGCKCH